MAKTRVTKTHPPAGRPDWSGLPVMMEEPAIVAVDHPAPVAHKADSGIPQGRGLPGIGRDAAGAEEYFGDLPVTRSGRLRSEARRVGEVVVSTCSSWWAPAHEKKNIYRIKP